MRRRQKRQLIELIETVREAQSSIDQLLMEKKYTEAGELLANCQDGAIAVGTALEAILEDMSPVISELESYCELVYEASLQMNSRSSLDRILKTSMGILDRVVYFLHNNIPTEYEIVFLPYKASMWDSMESIWIEFSNDHECRCHVIAIPYYDRNPDGSFRKEHMEKDQFPEYVKMTDYREYNLKERQPDVIFIHNPYDGANHVTSVHPDYYSSLIKDYTGLLIYVPYFITSNTCRDDYCTLPGVLYSDLTVVQSKVIRDSYIRTIKKVFELNEQQAQKLGLDQKIIALGSPKVDKVVHMKADISELPEEWKKQIAGAGKTAKKIILYNTSVDSILKNGKIQLEKIEKVFELFKKYKEVVLWWRPHPLSKATIQSMRPDLSPKYEELVTQFLCQGMGIYDDTADLHRAIALSDAYYGDWSSLIWIYMVTGKPVLAESVYVEEDKGLQLKVRDFEVYGGKIWFAATNLNMFFNVDLTDRTVKIIGEIPGERAFQPNLCLAIRRIGNIFVLIPAACRYIICYDIRTGKFKRHYVGCKREAKYLSAVVKKDWVYLLPLHEKAIVKYDINTNRMEETAKLENDPGKEKCRRNVLKTKNGFYFATGNDSRIFYYNFHSDSLQEHWVGEKEWKFYEIEKYKDSFFLASDDRIVLVGEESWQIKGTIDYPQQYRKTVRSPFIATVRFDNQWYLLPDYSDMILKVDMERQTAECFLDCRERKRCVEEKKSFPRYSSARGVDGVIYAISNYEDCLQMINTNTKEITNIPLRLSEEQQNLLMNRSFFSFSNQEGEEMYSFLEKESNIFTLEKYLNGIVDESKTLKDCTYKKEEEYFADTQGTCGKKIYTLTRACLEK